MGKKKQASQRRRDREDSTWASDNRPADAARVARSEKRHSAYYAAQLGLPDEEWAVLKEWMQRPLPVTFRLSGASEDHLRGLEAELASLCEKGNVLLNAAKSNGLQFMDEAAAPSESTEAQPAATEEPMDEAAAPTEPTEVSEVQPTATESTEVQPHASRRRIPLEPIEWRGLDWIFHGWHLSCERNYVRKSPYHRELHEWLKVHELAGTLTRQEAVSMIPPLFLGAQPRDRVLDTCAAPGSKTSQLLEAIGREEGGLLVANDNNLKRTHTLVHQMKRLNSASWCVTNADASCFPALYEDGKKRRFDRVLCDVPCSSDGTLRKTPCLLGKWRCADGLGLHTLQSRIARRGAQLLQPGATMVYSTCSMNPVENEAVVADLLRQEPTLHLVDASTHLPTLKRRPGLTSWKVFTDKDNDELLSQPILTEASDKRIRDTMFAPTEDNIIAELPRCMRFYPQDSDTGGFFVAVLKKEAGGADEGPPAKKAKHNKGNKLDQGAKGAFREDVPFVPFASARDFGPIAEFYGLGEDFPTDLLVTRVGGEANDEASKKVLLVSPAVRDLVTGAADAGLRVVHAGVIAMVRTSTQISGATDYRIAQDAVNLMLPYMKKRVVKCSSEDFEKLLDGGTVQFAALSGQLVQSLTPLEVGSLVLVLEGHALNTMPPAIVVWRGVTDGVAVYCSKPDLVVLRTKLDAFKQTTA